MEKTLFNTSYKNTDYVRESTHIVGKAFSFLEKIKIGGIGSSRIAMSELSDKLQPVNLQTIAVNYANIELRPKGIVIHFTNSLDRYSWVIPYYRLVIYSSETFSIHSNGSYIKFSKNRYYQQNIKFINKMMEFKNNFKAVEL
jgi:hypothetical protein